MKSLYFMLAVLISNATYAQDTKLSVHHSDTVKLNVLPKDEAVLSNRLMFQLRKSFLENSPTVDVVTNNLLSTQSGLSLSQRQTVKEAVIHKVKDFAYSEIEAGLYNVSGTIVYNLVYDERSRQLLAQARTDNELLKQKNKALEKSLLNYRNDFVKSVRRDVRERGSKSQLAVSDSSVTKVKTVFLTGKHNVSLNEPVRINNEEIALLAQHIKAYWIYQMDRYLEPVLKENESGSFEVKLNNTAPKNVPFMPDYMEKIDYIDSTFFDSDLDKAKELAYSMMPYFFLQVHSVTNDRILSNVPVFALDFDRPSFGDSYQHNCNRPKLHYVNVASQMYPEGENNNYGDGDVPKPEHVKIKKPGCLPKVKKLFSNAGLHFSRNNYTPAEVVDVSIIKSYFIRPVSTMFYAQDDVEL